MESAALKMGNEDKGTSRPDDQDEGVASRKTKETVEFLLQ